MALYDVKVEFLTNCTVSITKDLLSKKLHINALTDMLPMNCFYKVLTPLKLYKTVEYDSKISTCIKKMKKIKYISLKARNCLQNNQILFDYDECLKLLLNNQLIIQDEILQLKGEDIPYHLKINIKNKNNHIYEEYQLEKSIGHFIYEGDKLEDNLIYLSHLQNHFDTLKIIEIKEIKCQKDNQVIIQYAMPYSDDTLLENSHYLLEYKDKIYVKAGSYICFKESHYNI